MQNNLFEIRKSSGMSQMELAKKSGVSRTTIWQIETNPDYVAKITVIAALAKALDVTVDKLLCDHPAQQEDTSIEFTREEFQQLIDNGTIKLATEAEWSRFVLRALMNYHERITLNEGYPGLDCWKRGLQFAISCVEEKIPK